MIESNHEGLSINRQLQLISISGSSFYYVPARESEENLAILRLLDEQYFRTPFYGVLPLTALLVGLGYKVSRFTGDAFIKVLSDNEIKISMDGRGRALDNIFVERLWRNVKYEHIYLNVYQDGLSLWKGLDGYFRFYNRERPSGSILEL